MMRQKAFAPKEGEVVARLSSREDRLLYRKALAALGVGIRRYLDGKAPDGSDDPAM